MSSCSSTASLLPLVFSNNWQIIDSIHSTVSLANQRAWVGVTTQYSCISVRARAMYTLVTVATTPFQVSNTMSSWYYSELDDAAQSRYRAKLVLLGGIQDPYLQQTPTSDSLVEWPEVEYPDIYNYLVAIPSAYTQDQLKAYKSLNAYNFFVNGYGANMLLPVCLVLVRT